jgi:hypothetical protein
MIANDLSPRGRTDNEEERKTDVVRAHRSEGVAEVSSEGSTRQDEFNADQTARTRRAWSRVEVVSVISLAVNRRQGVECRLPDKPERASCLFRRIQQVLRRICELLAKFVMSIGEICRNDAHTVPTKRRCLVGVSLNCEPRGRRPGEPLCRFAPRPERPAVPAIKVDRDRKWPKLRRDRLRKTTKRRRLQILRN